MTCLRKESEECIMRIQKLKEMKARLAGLEEELFSFEETHPEDTEGRRRLNLAINDLCCSIAFLETL